MAMYRERGKAKYGVCDFVFASEDKFTDFKNTTTINYQPGSTVLITSPVTHYIYNDEKEWVKVTSSSSGSSGGDSDAETATDAEVAELLSEKFNFNN